MTDLKPVRFLSAGREGMIVTVDGKNVYIPTELSYSEGKMGHSNSEWLMTERAKPRWKDIEIRHAAFTEKAHSLDMPDDLVPIDQDTKASLAAFFEREKDLRAERDPDFPPYKLNY